MAASAELEIARASSPVRIRTVWLFGPRLDLFAFLAPALVALILVAAGRSVGLRSTPVWAFLLCVVAVDVAHVHSTAFRVYLDPSEMRRRPRLYLGVPILCYAAGVALHRTFGALQFWRVLAYVAVFHFVRQQVGWVRLYHARAAEPRLDRALDTATIYAATLYPLVDWHARLPRRFSWFLPGDFVAGVPGAVVPLAQSIWAALLIAFVARQIHLTVTGRGIHVGKVVVVGTTALCWWLGIVALDDDWSFTITNVLPHGVPYLVLIAYYARRRYAESAPPARVARALLRFGFLVVYLGLVAIALVEEGLWDRLVWHDHEALFGEGIVRTRPFLDWIVPLLALPQATHYVLDGLVWRRAENPDLSRWLS
jgi:hypothetical protein